MVDDDDVFAQLPCVWVDGVMAEPERLAKRLAAMLSCSRRQAEQYIEGGWVRVDGQVVETPQFKVLDQQIELDPDATLTAPSAVTLLLHKPPGYDWSGERRSAVQLLQPTNHMQRDRFSQPLHRRHFMGQACVTPLETGASGLVVYTQEWRIQRKLRDDAAQLENEVIVEVSGSVTPEILHRLNRAPVIDGHVMLPVKVSINTQSGLLTGLRFALKGGVPGQIEHMCIQAGLVIVAMKRIRVGRVPMAALPVGQWRYLLPYERF